MPHTDIHAISARQNKINKRWDKTTASFCCRTAAISAPFTPLSTFRFQPLPGVATHGVDVDITFHYVTSQFSAFGRLGVARRFLALLAGLAGLAGLAVLAATTCSHPQLPVGAGGEAMG